MLSSSSDDDARSAGILAVWLKANSKQCKDAPSTFTDVDGVKRYSHNWSEVSENNQLPKYDSGMSSISLGDYKDGTHTPVKQVLFLEDYVKAWNHLALQRSDALGRHAALFEAALLFMFDSRTACVLRFATVYLVAVLVVLMCLDPRPFIIMNNAVDSFMFMCLYGVYTASACVYKKSVDRSLFAGAGPTKKTAEMSQTHPATGSSHSRSRAVPQAPTSYFTTLYDNHDLLPFNFIMRAYLRHLFVETCLVFGVRVSPAGWEVPMSGGDRGSDSVGDGEVQLSVLHDAPATSSSETSIDAETSGSVSRQAYLHPQAEAEAEAEVQLLTGGITARCGYFLLLNVGLKFLEQGAMVPRYSNAGGHAVPGVSLGRSLNKLIVLLTAWQVAYVALTFVLSIVSLTCITGGSGSVSEMSDMTYECPIQWVYLVLTACSIIPVSFQLICLTSLSLSVLGLYYGSTIIHALATSWVERYAAIRKCREGGPDQVVATNVTLSATPTDVSGSCSGSGTTPAAGLSRRLRTDAYEHYLMIREYVAQISDLWSTPMLLLTVVSLTLMTYSFINVVIYGNLLIDATLLAFGFLFVILGLFAIYVLAYANSAVRKIEHALFHGSSGDDYEIIGGRDAWITCLQTSPAYWTIHGFAITWSSLYVYGSSAVTALFGILGSIAYHGW